MAVEERETTTEEEVAPALSVSAAMGLAKNALEEVVVRLVGEVSEVNDKPGYKAVYFTVKDQRAALQSMMWMNRYQASGVALSVGALVELTGRFSLYAAKGRMNFDVFSVSLAGEGQLRLQVANLARELEAMGLMDPARKRPLPAYPEAIGLVTSPRGAAVHDVLRTLRRRYPLARILFAGVPVEGPGAADGLVDGLAKVVFAGAEVVLLVRGGGSFEDLMPFNDRRLARTIAACPVPVVTGIGHEPDTSIADMVADVRASTPTAAAEAVAPAQGEIAARIQGLGAAMGHAESRRLDALSIKMERVASLPLFREPTRLFDGEALALDDLSDRLGRALPEALREDRQTGAYRRGAGPHAARAALGAQRSGGRRCRAPRLPRRALRRALPSAARWGPGAPDARRRGDDRPLSRVGGRERGAPARSVASGHHRPRLRHGQGGGRPSGELGGRRRGGGAPRGDPLRR